MNDNMNGWAQSKSGKWHQVEFKWGGAADGTVVYLCNGGITRMTPDRVMDYRWRPPWGQHCQHMVCQREVPD